MGYRPKKQSWIVWIAAVPIVLMAASGLWRGSGGSEFEADACLVAAGVATVLLFLRLHGILRQAEAARDEAESGVLRANVEVQEKSAQLDLLNRDLDQIKVRTDNLERSNVDLQQFSSIASHDLQEPLRMVVSYLGLLEQNFQGKLTADQEKFMKFAVEGAKRMQTLVRDLQAYSEAGAQLPVLTPTLLNDVVTQARYSLLETMRASGAEIRIGPLPEVEVDPLKMGVIFQHLLSNGIKFRRPAEKPNIQIEARQDDGAWRISVRDQGIGFDPKYAEKIFGPFQRLHGRNEYPGTGIGLALCRRLVEAHGGRIWAEAQPGQGATFHFTIPAMSDSMPGDRGEGSAILKEERNGREHRRY